MQGAIDSCTNCHWPLPALVERRKMKILVPLDVSPASQMALGFLSRRPYLSRQSDITLMTVHQLIRPSLMRLIAHDDIEKVREAAADEILKNAQQHFEALGKTPEFVTTVGDPVEEIVKKARDIGADLILMAAHGERNLGDILMGSVSRGVLAHAPCPVLMVRNQLPAAGRPLRVVVPVDTQEVTSHAVDWVIEHRELFGPMTDFRLVHAVENSSMDVLPRFTTPGSAMSELALKGQRNAKWHEAVDPVAQRFAAAGLTSRNIALAGRASQAIADYVTREEIDLIVIGSHARGELKALILGSVAAEVMSLTNAPMIIIR